MEPPGNSYRMIGTASSTHTIRISIPTVITQVQSSQTALRLVTLARAEMVPKVATGVRVLVAV